LKLIQQHKSLQQDLNQRIEYDLGKQKLDLLNQKCALMKQKEDALTQEVRSLETAFTTCQDNEKNYGRSYNEELAQENGLLQEKSNLEKERNRTKNADERIKQEIERLNDSIQKLEYEQISLKRRYSTYQGDPELYTKYNNIKEEVERSKKTIGQLEKSFYNITRKNKEVDTSLKVCAQENQQLEERNNRVRPTFSEEARNLYKSASENTKNFDEIFNNSTEQQRDEGIGLALQEQNNQAAQTILTRMRQSKLSFLQKYGGWLGASAGCVAGLIITISKASRQQGLI
jgi:chromosome segregation ATPase